MGSHMLSLSGLLSLCEEGRHSQRSHWPVMSTDIDVDDRYELVRAVNSGRVACSLGRDLGEKSLAVAHDGVEVE